MKFIKINEYKTYSVKEINGRTHVASIIIKKHEVEGHWPDYMVAVRNIAYEGAKAVHEMEWNYGRCGTYKDAMKYINGNIQQIEKDIEKTREHQEASLKEKDCEHQANDGVQYAASMKVGQCVERKAFAALEQGEFKWFNPIITSKYKFDAGYCIDLLKDLEYAAYMVIEAEDYSMDPWKFGCTKLITKTCSYDCAAKALENLREEDFRLLALEAYGNYVEKEGIEPDLELIKEIIPIEEGVTQNVSVTAKANGNTNFVNYNLKGIKKESFLNEIWFHLRNGAQVKIIYSVTGSWVWLNVKYIFQSYKDYKRWRAKGNNISSIDHVDKMLFRS